MGTTKDNPSLWEVIFCKTEKIKTHLCRSKQYQDVQRVRTLKKLEMTLSM